MKMEYVMELTLAKQIYRDIKQNNYEALTHKVLEHRILLFLGSFFNNESELKILAQFLLNNDSNPNLRSNIFILLYLRGQKKFSGYNLSYLNLFGFDFQEMNFDQCNFEASDLRKCNFQDSSIQHANFSYCSLSDANLRRSKLNNSNFHKSDLSGAKLADCEMKSVILTRSHLCGTEMNCIQMPSADLEQAYLFKCNCRFSNFTDSNFKKAILIETDFTGADFENCDLRESDLKFTNLQNAILFQTKCDGADFLGADLRKASIPIIFNGINLELAITNRPILRLIKNPFPPLYKEKTKHPFSETTGLL
ncbi:MAG: hypothetical protein A2161_01440 [Candidatus Schekmanbacteria bacterium RBG_13_48_7]|uniref:Low-complexity protein n=1 Tax=Candidatus Schekmanbacteria bacterium RBG_13_48_7 TaxID=1817878 RepID=A0A1F7S266_9BACT|nr:MAG: hypothetical protein A2161_01440 [Candidatus Schekmanbacteria bacterium RBG_13_48_7]